MTVTRCHICCNTIHKNTTPLQCGKPDCPEVCHKIESCSGISRYNLARPKWFCRKHGGKGPNTMVRPTIPDTDYGNCTACGNKIRKNNRPVECSVPSCPGIAHRQEKCCGISRYRDASSWTCGSHRDPPTSPPSDNPPWRQVPPATLPSFITDDPSNSQDLFTRSIGSPPSPPRRGSGSIFTFPSTSSLLSQPHQPDPLSLLSPSTMSLSSLSSGPFSPTGLFTSSPRPPSGVTSHIQPRTSTSSTGTNPGPTEPPTPKLKCGSCKKTIATGTTPIECNACNRSFHKRCTETTRSFQESVLAGLTSWECDPCLEKLRTQNQPEPNIEDRVDASEPANPVTNALRVMQWNAGGIARKIGELEERLKTQLIDVCLIQESKLRKTDRTPFIKGFSTLRQDRVGGTGGGLLTFIRNEIAFERLPGSQKDGTEIQRCRIKFSKNRWATIANVYCPPNNSLGNTTTTLRTDLLPSDAQSVIAGDLNAHSALWDDIQPDDARGEQVEDLLLDKSLTLLNTGEHTRVNPATGTLSTPDVTLVGKYWADRADWQPVEDLGSDHLPIIFSLRTELEIHQQAQRPARWKTLSDMSAFTAEVEESMRNVSGETNLHKRVRRFQDILTQAAKKHVGKTKPGKRRKVCMTPTVRAAIKKRNDLRKEVSTRRKEWVEACREASRLLDEAKSEVWEEALAESEMDSQEMWKLIRSLNGCPDSNNPNEALLHNNRLVTSNKKKAEIFAIHYKNVSKVEISSEERKNVHKELKHVLKNTSTVEDESSLPFTPAELKAAIKKCRKKGAPGPDDIPPTFLKALGPLALEELLAIFNSSLDSADLPHIWRTATIIPLLKAGKSAKDLASYRPISLTSCVVKVMERMVADRLYHLAEKNGMFNRLQAGFRKGRSCQDQILRLVQAIDDGFQRKPANRTVMALLDLSKAYDRVWRQKLLLNLYQRGVSQTLLKWLEAFLHNRTARVNYNNSFSTLHTLKQGLPQGSVLAPLLFLFYIDTLAQRLPDNTINSLFADDVTITGSGSSLQQAQRNCQRAVDVVVEWCREYKMILSDKSVSSFFTTSGNEASWRPTIHAGDLTLKYDPTPRLLGVILDRQLTFGPHVKSVKEKLNSKCRILAAVSNTSWGWRKSSLLKVYNTHIRSILDYAAPAWQPWLSETNKRELEVLQNKALRLVTGQYRSTPLEALRTEAGVPSYSTQSKRLILTAKEKALRAPADHPSRLATEGSVRHRLKRSSFKSTAEELGSHLPSAFEQRELLCYSTPPPWSQGGDINISPTLPGETTKSGMLPEALRTLAMNTIKNHQADITIYTDGSAEEGTRCGGNGTIITTGTPEEPEVMETLMRRGRQHTSSFEEEMAAMETASGWIRDHPQYHKILICTDSKSLCDSMASATPSAPVANLMYTMGKSPSKIKVQWIPSHVDIPGNELADTAAKQAASLEEDQSQASQPISFAAVKAHIRREIVDPPISHERTAEAYKHYKKDTDKDIRTRFDQTTLARLRSGHHKNLRAYQHRIDENVDPSCRHCPGKDHTLQHWLTECDATAEERHRIFGTTSLTTDILSANPPGVVELARRTLF